MQVTFKFGQVRKTDTAEFIASSAGNKHRNILFYAPGNNPDSKVHGANMGPTWGQLDPGMPHVGHVNFAIWEWYRQK